MTHEELIIELPAKKTDLARCRAEVEKRAAAMGFKGDDLWGIVSAVFEACANAITHGRNIQSDHKEPHDRFTLSISTCKDRFKAVIKDSGDGFICPSNAPMPTPAARRGRGIPMMKAFMDEVKFERDKGCKVTLITYLRAAAHGKCRV
jgi:serine/threonine-protein kinase RsbW